MRNALLNVLMLLALVATDLPRELVRALRQAARDKLEHFVAGVLVSTTAAVMASPAALLALPMVTALLALAAVSVVAAFAVGAIKELLDAVSRWRARRKGLEPTAHVELGDAVATGLGGVPMALVLVTVALVLAVAA